jgi:glycosyltransferase involved in cell wall biosynthesis
MLPERLRRLGLALSQPSNMLRVLLASGGDTLQKFRHATSHLGCCSVKPQSTIRGRVLVSYILHALLLDECTVAHASPVYYHANAARTRAIVKTFLDLGYAVDLLSERNALFRPRCRYDIVAATRFDMERLAALVPRSCLKIVHLETADIYFHGIAELARLQALQARRGMALQPDRLESPHRALECCDFATLTGNAFTLGTYQNPRVPIYLTPAAPRVRFSRPAGKDFDACRKRFLWIGSEGFVHKGLDLVLEAFAAMPEMDLTVCGPLHREPEFAACYHKELHEKPNIHVVGWMDTESAAFSKLAASCAGLVYPSCSEGQSGAVLTCLHAGLIPIMSCESGVDAGDFGKVLTTSTVPEIRDAVRDVAARPAAMLEKQARSAWEFANAHHTIDAFSTRYRQVILEILASRGMARPADGAAPAAELLGAKSIAEKANVSY